MLNIKRKNQINEDISMLIPIEKIKKGEIILKDGRKLLMFKVEPTNFKLKTNMEQQSILEGYKMFLKKCNFNMQILIQTQKREINYYVENIKKTSKCEGKSKEMLDDYISFLKEISQKEDTILRSFYIVIESTKLNEEEITIKIKESLRMCDNEVEKCEFDEIVKVVSNYLNRKNI